MPRDASSLSVASIVQYVERKFLLNLTITSSTVLTATFNSYRNRQISTPHNIDTPVLIDKKSAQLITSVRGPSIPNLVEIQSLRSSGKMGEI